MKPCAGLLFLVWTVLAACRGGEAPARSTATPRATGDPADASLEVNASVVDAAAPIVDVLVDAGDVVADAGVWPNATKGFVAKLHADLCFGNCAVYTVTIEADGSFVVAVDRPRKGCIRGVASQWKVGRIQVLAHDTEFTKIQHTLESGQTDRRWITTTITDRGQTYSVKRWGNVPSDRRYATVIAIEDAIIDATDAANLADTGALAPCAKPAP